MLSRDLFEQMPDHVRPDSASPVGRCSPDVEKIGIADTVGEEPRHRDESFAIASKGDMLRLAKGAADARG